MNEIVPAADVTIIRGGRLTPTDLREQIEAVEELVRDGVLRDKHDYGTIPGTPKPTLFKPGAERLLMWSRFGHRMEQVEVERDDQGRKYGVTYRCLVHALDDPTTIVATCDGYCGYDEPDRDEHQNRWGKIIPRSPWNTILKMAQKRALVGAALQATGTSSLFTQDLDDLATSAEAGGVRNDQLGDVSKLSNRQVVDALKERNLPLAGKPEELRERLAEALGAASPSSSEGFAATEGSSPRDLPDRDDNPGPSDVDVPATSTGLPAQNAGEVDDAPRTEAPTSPATIDALTRDRLLARMDALPDETRRAVEDACVTACDGRFPNELTAADVPTVSELIDDGAASVKPGAALAARAAKHAKSSAA